MNGLGDLFGIPKPPAPSQPSQKPLPRIRGKRFNGELYVDAEDVAQALESQAPTTNRRLIEKLRAAAQHARTESES